MDGFKTARTRLTTVSLSLALLALAGCGGGGSGGEGQVLGARAEIVSLEQAVFDGSRYEYGGGGGVPTIRIEGAPDDADRSRWAMANDGGEYRLYFMRLGSDTTLYQFGYNDATQTYEFGHNSIPQMDITGTPPEASASSIAMLHDGDTYRLYMRGRDDVRKLYQFGFNTATGDYEFGHRSIAVIDTTNVPPDADFSRWAMLHDGSVYRLYVAKAGSETTLYQFGFDGRTYDFGYRSITEIDVVGMPASSDEGSFAMLFGNSRYRFYHLTR